MQAIYVISNFLVTTSKNKTGEILIFYLTQHTQNIIISLCNIKKLLMGYITFFFVVNHLNLLYIFTAYLILDWPHSSI